MPGTASEKAVERADSSQRCVFLKQCIRRCSLPHLVDGPTVLGAAAGHVLKGRAMTRNLITIAALSFGLSAAALAPAGAATFGGGGGIHEGGGGGFGGGGFHGGGVGFHGGFGGFHGGGFGRARPAFGGASTPPSVVASHPAFGGAPIRPSVVGSHPAFGGAFRPRIDRFNHRFFAGRFHHRRFLRTPFFADSDPYDDGYDYGYPYSVNSGYCYLTHRWVWNGHRRVHRLVRLCQ
jgi:hypothetical protein